MGSNIGARPFIFGRFKRKDIDDLEEEAKLHHSDPKKQAIYYKELLKIDPESVVHRFEDPQYARDMECVRHYLTALQETNQLHRATKYFVGSTDVPDPSVLGSKDRPIYIMSKQTSPGWRRLGILTNVVIVGSIVYFLYTMNEQKLGGITGKVHKQFSADGAMHSFADVQGCDEAKHEMEEIVEFLKNPSKFNKLGAKMPKGVLLVGPPGTGKTLLAKAVAGEAKVPFYYASGSSFDEVFVGIGSMRIRQMFETAKQNAPSIVFIDELDAIGSKRNPRDPQHSRMSLNQLLTELDGFAESSGVVVIAATNIPEALDKALLRPGRFDKHVYVPLPDLRGREKILEMYLNKVQLATDVDIKTLAKATPGFSGADLSKLANQAKILASLQNRRTVSMRNLEDSKDEMIMGAERKSTIIGPEDKQLTAYHEGGHAIVALNTKSIMIVLFVHL